MMYNLLPDNKNAKKPPVIRKNPLVQVCLLWYNRLDLHYLMSVVIFRHLIYR